MGQRLGFYGLNKKLSVDKLINKVGGIYFKPNKSGGKIASGVQRGANLKRTLIYAAKGKTPYTFNRELQFKYGIAGSQGGKRKKIMELIKDGKKNGLTEEQVKKNLKFNIQKDESGLTKQEYKTSFAGGRVSTKSIGAKGTMEDIGIKRGATGFAQNYHNTKLPGNPAPKPPSTGIRPIGL